MIKAILGQIGAIAGSATRDELDALNWMKARAVKALDLAGKLTSGDLEELASQASNVALINEVISVFLAALEPAAQLKKSVRDAQLVTTQTILDTIAKMFHTIAGAMAVLQRAIPGATVLDSASYVRWFAPSIRARVKALREDLSKVATDPGNNQTAIRQYIADLDSCSRDAGCVVDELGRIAATDDLSQLVNLRTALDEALDAIGIPSSVRLSYDWDTNVNPYPGGAGAVFQPLDTKKLTIKSLAVADLRHGTAPQVSVDATLDRFKINLFGAASFFSVIFKPLVFSAGTGRSAKLTVDVETVEFGGELAFVKTLQQWLSEKFGILVTPWDEGPGVVVGYNFSRDIIQVTAFTLQNVGFTISCVLPFNSQPARFRFRLSSPERPFLLSAGIYGGGGFVGLQSRADAIEFLGSLL